MKVEKIIQNDNVIAIVFFAADAKEGVNFLTDNDNALQVGTQLRKEGTVIPPHRHAPVKMESVATQQEVLIIKKGKLRVGFYDEQWNKYNSVVIGQGDMILLIKGGHGFEILEETEMIEIKQGPYNAQATERMETKKE